MKKPAARDFEDLLQVRVHASSLCLCNIHIFFQCAIPCFDSLLPAPHHAIVMDLLFALAMWHAYAKLRLHTDSTLTSLELATTALGQHMRKFKAMTCASYETVELPGEETRRVRRQVAKATNQQKKTPALSAKKKKLTQPRKRRKDFNISTYKNHALGHYAKTIRLFGTTDSYTSQVVSQSLFYSISADLL